MEGRCRRTGGAGWGWHRKTKGLGGMVPQNCRFLHSESSLARATGFSKYERVADQAILCKVNGMARPQEGRNAGIDGFVASSGGLRKVAVG